MTKSQVAFGVAAACLLLLAFLLVRDVLAQRIVVEGTRYSTLGDDAMISMRYAYNLAHARGLVWNVGERVQGITNLGWTLVMAFPLWIGVPLPVAPLVVQLVNIALHIATVALLFAWSWQRGRPVQAVVAGTLVALDGSSLAWGIGGFETTLQALLVTAAVLPFFEDRGRLTWAPIWAALAVTVRPDSMLVFLWVAAMILADRRPRQMLALGTGGAIVVVVFAFQRLYYGDWLPNTFYLKAAYGHEATMRGLAYVGRFAFSEFFSFPLLLAPVACLGLHWSEARRWLPLASLPVAWTVYVVLIGGDAFVNGRFFIPIVPMLALFTGRLLEDLVRFVVSAGKQRAVASLLLGSGLTLLVILGAGNHVVLGRELMPYLPHFGAVHPKGESSVRIAVALRKSVPTSAVIGVYYAGTTPYFMPDHRFHDFLGKSDPVIARSASHPGPPGHNKWDYAYSLGRVRPDVIITAGPFVNAGALEYSRLVDTGVDYAFHPALWLAPMFQADYKRVTSLTDGVAVGNEQWVYFRRSSGLVLDTRGAGG